MPKLALDDVDRHTLTSELDRVRVAQLVGRETAPDAGLGCQRSQLATNGSRRPCPTARRAVEDAEQRPDRQLNALLDPDVEVVEPSLIESQLAALVTLAVADKQRPSAPVNVNFCER